MRYIETLKDGERISEVYLCKSKSTATTKAGKEYENVMLMDKTGQLDSKIWDPNSGGISDFDALDYVAVTGQVTSFNGALQLKIDRIRKADEGEYIESDYIPSSRFNIDDMYKELLQFAGSIKNTYISSLLKAFFVDDADFIRKFKSVAAGKSVHHGFAGGLLEHSLSVTRMCDKIASNYDFLNRDLLVACGMLHDCGKVRELAEFPKNDYTDEGQLLGHIMIGAEMVGERMRQIPGFPVKLGNELKHCILAHHGELEYGSPKKPALLEAVALNFADNTDAHLQTMIEALTAAGENQGWLGYNRLFESNIRKTSK